MGWCCEHLYRASVLPSGECRRTRSTDTRASDAFWLSPQCIMWSLTARARCSLCSSCPSARNVSGHRVLNWICNELDRRRATVRRRQAISANRRSGRPVVQRYTSRQATYPSRVGCFVDVYWTLLLLGYRCMSNPLFIHSLIHNALYIKLSVYRAAMKPIFIEP